MFQAPELSSFTFHFRPLPPLPCAATLTASLLSVVRGDSGGTLIQRLPQSPHLQISIYVQLTLEQHRFELCGSTSMWTFFSKFTVSPVSPGFTFTDSTIRGSKTVFSIWSWELVDVYATFCAILYKGLKQLQDLLSTGKEGPGTNPPWIRRDN